MAAAPWGKESSFTKNEPIISSGSASSRATSSASQFSKSKDGGSNQRVQGASIIGDTSWGNLEAKRMSDANMPGSLGGVDMPDTVPKTDPIPKTSNRGRDVFNERSAQVKAASEVVGSRWGPGEVDRLNQTGLGSLKDIPMPDIGGDQESIYERRSGQVQEAASQGQSRWDPSETGRSGPGSSAPLDPVPMPADSDSIAYPNRNNWAQANAESERLKKFDQLPLSEGPGANEGRRSLDGIDEGRSERIQQAAAQGTSRWGSDEVGTVATGAGSLEDFPTTQSDNTWTGKESGESFQQSDTQFVVDTAESQWNPAESGRLRTDVGNLPSVPMPGAPAGQQGPRSDRRLGGQNLANQWAATGSPIRGRASTRMPQADRSSREGTSRPRDDRIRPESAAGRSRWGTAKAQTTADGVEQSPSVPVPYPGEDFFEKNFEVTRVQAEMGFNAWGSSEVLPDGFTGAKIISGVEYIPQSARYGELAEEWPVLAQKIRRGLLSVEPRKQSPASTKSSFPLDTSFAVTIVERDRSGGLWKETRLEKPAVYGDYKILRVERGFDKYTWDMFEVLRDGSRGKQLVAGSPYSRQMVKYGVVNAPWRDIQASMRGAPPPFFNSRPPRPVPEFPPIAEATFTVSKVLRDRSNGLWRNVFLPRQSSEPFITNEQQRQAPSRGQGVRRARPKPSAAPIRIDQMSTRSDPLAEGLTDIVELGKRTLSNFKESKELEVPSWWVFPEAYLLDDCLTVRDMLNQQDFEVDIYQLAVRALTGAERVDWRVEQAEVALLGPAGIVLRTWISESNGSLFCVGVSIPFGHQVFTVEEFRQSVVQLIAEAQRV